jgi:hypothetical protein
MDCKRVEDLLGSICEGTLEGDLAGEVRRHIEACAHCASEKLAVVRTMEALRAFDRIEPSDDFSSRLWFRIDQLETSRSALWLTAIAAFVRRNRRVLVTCCTVFVVSLLGGVFMLRNMVGGPGVEMAERAGPVESFVIREIPQPVAATQDTFFMHFVTGDRPAQPSGQAEDYVFRPVVKPVSDVGPAF